MKDVAGETTYFLCADEGLVGEYSDTGSMQKVYGWKPGGLWGTAPLYMVEGGQYYWYHNDHLGTPHRLTDNAGQVAWAAGYRAFGEAVVDPAATITNNLRFPGQYFDSETNLHYNYFRDYNPVVGRYVQSDPIGLAGGINLFAYVQNNPLLWFDPWGLEAELRAAPGIKQRIMDRVNTDWHRFKNPDAFGPSARVDTIMNYGGTVIITVAIGGAYATRHLVVHAHKISGFVQYTLYDLYGTGAPGVYYTTGAIVEEIEEVYDDLMDWWARLELKNRYGEACE